LPVLVALNHFTADTAAEVALVQAAVEALGASLHVCRHWAQGGSGALDLAHAVAAQVQQAATPHLLYTDDLSLAEKLTTVAQKMYGASAVTYSELAQQQLEKIKDASQGLPVCIAKTQYSLSCDAKLRNVPQHHVLHVRELRLSRGAGFVVAICGDIMTMPGLPKRPASARISVNANGRIVGLS
jgi:formate--tetrahydrofolate ligase